MKQKCALGVKVIFLFLVLNFQVGGQDRTSQYENKFNIRPISEINEKGYGDAYPVISDDGLRLYYTAQDHLEDVSAIHFASRPDVSSPFDYFEKLSINSTEHDNLCAWVSADEHTISFVQRQRDGDAVSVIYMANRANISSSFEKPTKINLKGNLKGTILSPSFSQDLEELILYNEYENHSYIIAFNRIDKYTYKLRGEIKLPKKYRIKSGKLSSDGLDYYISLERSSSKPQIYVLTRDKIGENFKLLHPLKNDIINDREFRTHQAYFSGNKAFVVFTRSSQNEWLHNEMFIGQKEAIAKIVPEISIDQNKERGLSEISIFPNPSIEFVSISNPGNKDLHVEIFDYNGILVQELKKDEINHYINISDFVAGSYVFRITDFESGLSRSFIVAKVE